MSLMPGKAGVASCLGPPNRGGMGIGVGGAVIAIIGRGIGGALVAANIARHVAGPLADRDGGWRPLVYCWRGGQRSGSFATILDQIGAAVRRIMTATAYDRPPGEVSMPISL